jgi:hypothetical protein
MPAGTLSRRLRWVIPARWGMFGAAALLLTASCAGTTSATVAYDYPATYVETVPVDIAYYPRVYYRGHYAYWVHDRWYYPSGRRWVVFREEPHELQRYRIYNPHRFEVAPPRYRPTPELGIPDRRYDRDYRAPVVVPEQQPRYRTPAAPQQAPPRYQAPQVVPHQPQLRQAPSHSPPAPRYHAPQQAPHQGQRHYRPR